MKRILFTVVLLSALAPFLFASPPASLPSAAALNAEREHGLLITSVLPDSPALRAGIVRGDILIELGGTKVSTPDQIRKILANHSAGETIVAVVIHGSQIEKVPITLEVRLYHPILGMDFSGDHVQPDTNAPQGVYVDSVVAGGPAERAGIRAGDVVLALNGRAIDATHSLAALVDQCSPGQQISVRIEQPNKQKLTLSVQLGKTPSGGPLLGLHYSKAPTQRPGFGSLFKSFNPSKWFRYFGEPLFPNQTKKPQSQGSSNNT